jgi:hypothetical protein
MLVVFIPEGALHAAQELCEKIIPHNAIAMAIILPVIVFMFV